MTEWGVVGVLVVIVGLMSSVMVPVIKLNTAVTTLTVTLKNVTGDLDELTTKNSRTHERLWAYMDEHDARLSDHDKRISLLEDRKTPHQGVG